MDHVEALERAVASLPAFVRRRRLDALGEPVRLELTRELEDGSKRYLWVSWAGEPEEDSYSIMGGLYGSPDPTRNFDSRSWGDLKHAVTVIRMWLIDLCDWLSLPRGDAFP